jgi:Membrane dipeptidase (Peptidase family M19)
MTDDMLRAVAKNGGVVQTNFYSAFIDDNYRKAAEAQKKDSEAAVDARVAELRAAGKPITYLDKDQIEREWAAKIPRPPLKSLIDHVDHIAKVAGVDHVGLGSDFDGVSGAMPEGMDSAGDLPKITQALLDRGYSAKDIHKILGGNLLRVFGEVERVSREMQAEAARTSTRQWLFPDSRIESYFAVITNPRRGSLTCPSGQSPAIRSVHENMRFNLFADGNHGFGELVSDRACGKNGAGEKTGHGGPCQTSGHNRRSAHGHH